MTRRERFIRTMTFDSPDRPATGDYLVYESMRERWESEGLPKGADYNEYFGFDFDPFRWQVPVNWRIDPFYDDEVIEETEDYIVRRQGHGEVVRYLKNSPPPAMPQWISYPLKSRADWDKFKKRLDPNSPGRLPANFAEMVAEYKKRDYPLGMWGAGSSYGVMRDWWGVEELSVLFYDDPSLIEEMMEYLTHLHLTLLDKVLAYDIQLDWVAFWEDMAYKNGPLISPAMYEKYCMPLYRKAMEKVHAAGIPVAMVDSDGDVRELIPMWLDAGVSIMHPMEVASSMDVIQARKQYGKQICFFGGIDKRPLAGSFEDIRKEVLPKLEACLGEGGFIPACDHAVPPDVSFDNYRYYRDLINQASEK